MHLRHEKGVISPGTAANEKTYTATRDSHRWDGSKRAAIVLPGRGWDALTPLSTLASTPGGDVLGALEVGLPVLCIDAGGTLTFGNDTAIARLEEAVAWVASSGFGRSDGVLLCGTSMGSMLAASYIGKNATNRGKVTGAALFYPSRLDYAYNNGYAAEINTAYTDAAGYTAAKPTHDVIDLATAGKLNGVPIKGWYSTNDTTAGVSTWADIKAALAAGGASVPAESSLGAVGHGDNTLIPRSEVAAWLGSHA
jgi:dienelactone hydrolase